VVRLISDNDDAECDDDASEPLSLWYTGERTDAQIATLLDRLLNQGSPPASDCNFLGSTTCRTIPVVITDQSSVAGTTETSGSYSWILVGLGMNDYEIPHEIGHAGIGECLCDEYDADEAGPTQPCWGAQVAGNATDIGCANLHNRNSTEKWDDYITSSPVEGGGYCNDDVWKPTSDSIMSGGLTDGDFDALGLAVMDKGLARRLGDIEDDGPAIDCDLNDTDIKDDTVTITCTVTDASDIEFVEFSIAENGARHYYLGFDDTSPYTVTLDTTQYADGSYWVQAIAWDEHFNVNNDSDTGISFTIDNDKVYPSDMTYLGAFDLPTTPGWNWSTGIYGGAGYYASGDPNDAHHGNASNYPGSIFLKAYNTSDGYFGVAEISIPTPIDSATKSQGDLTDAVFLQTPDYICENGGSSPTNGYQSGAQSSQFRYSDAEYYDDGSDRLYWTMCFDYMPSETYKHLGRSTIDISSPTIDGTWKFADKVGVDIEGGDYGAYLLRIPTAWATANVSDQYLGTGMYRLLNGGFGPSLFSCAPWDGGAFSGSYPDDCPGGDCDIPYTQLIRYEDEEGSHWMNEMSPNSTINDGVWVEIGDKEAVVFYGTLTERSYEDGTLEYSNGTYGPVRDCGGKGYKSGPFYPFLAFYDPDDLIDVIDDTIEPYEPQPYAILQLTDIFYDDFLCVSVGSPRRITGGIAYDATKNLIYAVETQTDIVHVWSLSDGSGILDKTVPSAPTNLSVGETVTHTGLTLTWSAATDAGVGGVAYWVYRNDKVIGITDETTWTDNNLEYDSAPYEYIVRAVDLAYNYTDSASYTVTAANDPLRIFCPSGHYYDEGMGTKVDDVYPESDCENGRAGCRYQSHYFTMPPKGTGGSEYSVDFDVEGGTAPYAWSCYSGSSSMYEGTGSCISGMSINSSTGVFSGNPSNGWHSFIIEVEDDNDNLFRLQCSWEVKSSPSDCDYDGDTTGESDPDDFDYNDQVVDPEMTAPTNAKLTGSTFSWTEHADVDVVGYKVYYDTGCSSEIYVGDVTDYDVSGLASPYCVTAFDMRGLESSKSGEVSGTAGVTMSSGDGGASCGGSGSASFGGS